MILEAAGITALTGIPFCRAALISSRYRTPMVTCIVRSTSPCHEADVSPSLSTPEKRGMSRALLPWPRLPASKTPRGQEARSQPASGSTRLRH